MDELGALSLSILAGLGGAAAAYYLTRLYLSREELVSGGVARQDTARGVDELTDRKGRRGADPAALPAAGGASNADD